MTQFPFGPWRPDVIGPNTGVAVIADGVLPQSIAGSGIGYGPMPQMVTADAAVALAGAPRGIVSVQLFDGTWKVYAASAAKIQVLSSVYGWSDIDTGRAVTSGDDVSFVHFGSFLVNTDTTSGMKAYNVQTPAGNNAVSGAPASRSLAICQNVIFAFDCAGNNRRMVSSGQGSHTAWDGSLGGDGKTFEDGGALIGGRDLKNGSMIVFQDKALRLVQFGPSAGSALYSVVKIADGRGCVADRTAVSFDGSAFWWDTDGPWQFSMQGGLVPIGAEKINRWAAANIGASNYKNLQGVIDPSRNIVMWRIDGVSVLVYNWVIKEFSTLPATTSVLARIATPGVAIDDLTGTIDSYDVEINNQAWQGGAPVLSALDANYKFATFTGNAMLATLQTSETLMPQSALVTSATPISDASGSMLELGVKDAPDDMIVWKGAESKTDSGRVHLRGRGKVVAFRETIPAAATWTYAAGIDHVQIAAGGAR